MRKLPSLHRDPIANASIGDKIACTSCKNKGLLLLAFTIALAAIPQTIEYDMSTKVSAHHPATQA